MEFTLEDTLEVLKETQIERQKQIEDLMNIILNNNPVALGNASNPEDVRRKQEKLYRSLLYHVRVEQDTDFPIARTSDMQLEALTELEKEVETSQNILDRMKSQLSVIKDDISYLESKKLGLEKMRKAYSGAAHLKTGTTYDKERVITKRIFRKVKDDLHSVVELLFPDNQEFRMFLGDLVSSYTKGGNDLYVDVTPEVLDFVNFLIEANIAMHHRNDKSKVRLTDPL